MCRRAVRSKRCSGLRNLDSRWGPAWRCTGLRIARKMADENSLVPRENGSNGHVELVPVGGRFASFDLSPREPHLYDYLLILRKHQWLILSFILSVVTIVSIATFRMRPVYVATARIEIDRENADRKSTRLNSSHMSISYAVFCLKK